MKKKLSIFLVSLLVFSCLPLGAFANTTSKQGKIYRESGVVKYEGQLVNGVPNGIGKLYGEYSNGYGAKAVLNYEGEFKNGKPHGYGKSYSDGEVIYMGQYKDGKKCGFGASFVEGGVDKIGEFANDYPHGWGIDYDYGKFANEYISNNGKFIMLLTKDISKVTPLPLKAEWVELEQFNKDKFMTPVIDEVKFKATVNQYSANPTETIRKLSQMDTLKSEGDYGNGYGKLYNKDGQLIFMGDTNKFGATFFDDMVSYVGEYKNGHQLGYGVTFIGGKFRAEFYVTKEADPYGSKWITNNLKELTIDLPFDKKDMNRILRIEDLDEDRLIDIIDEYKPYKYKEPVNNEPPTA